MSTVPWIWTTNLILDLIGYFLEVLSWFSLTWVILGAAIAIPLLKQPLYIIPIVVICAFVTGLILRWFAKGVYKRKTGRMLFTAILCLLVTITLTLTIILMTLPIAQVISLMGQLVLYAASSVALFIGLAKHKVLADQNL